MSKFPHVVTFSESSKLLAHMKICHGGDPWEIATLVGESVGVSIRYQFLNHLRKQIRWPNVDLCCLLSYSDVVCCIVSGCILLVIWLCVAGCMLFISGDLYSVVWLYVV